MARQECFPEQSEIFFSKKKHLKMQQQQKIELLLLPAFCNARTVSFQGFSFLFFTYFSSH